MNRGLAIFKKRQRFQGGSENLEPGPLPYDKIPHGFKTRAGIYDPGGKPASERDQAQQELEQEMAQEQRDWEENIKQVLSYTPNLTSEERNQVQTLNPKDWDDSTREKVGAASEQAGRDTQLQRGTSNIMQTTPNQGLRLFMAHQKLKRPQGYAGGSSGIHIKPENKGKFTALQKRTGQSTEELKHSSNPLTRKRAVFAQMARRHFKPL